MPDEHSWDTLTVAPHEVGLRLDHFLTHHYPDQSRSSLNKIVNSSHVLVNNQSVKSGYRLRPNDLVTLTFPAPPSEELNPERIDFPVLFEDDHLLVLSKPPGLVVHPACGHAQGTLVHGLLYHCKRLPAVAPGRPGIVHRLDKDTSGVMLVAKTELALRTLMADFKDRNIHKTYHALLLRSPRELQGRIVQPIGRHPVDRKKMAIRAFDGRYAATNWEVLEQFNNGWCLVEVRIETGRTHQIRVHMASIHSPVLGDLLYGGAVERNARIVPDRQMLHASTLCFRHPEHGREMRFTAALWPDMQQILDALRVL
jgi:23S rRNA pseudouridine1911/1915/1917 synthase